MKINFSSLEPSPKPNNRDDDDPSIVNDEDIDPSREATPEMSGLDDTVKDTDVPSTPKPDNKTPPRQKESSPLHETSHSDKKPQSTPPPAATSATNDAADDFFDD